ncbi:MAG TPA: Flp family type IVb pilin [Dehalococcoidia bacterium]|jgi:Flp pilus assembly pilin Flp|nr:Flp family type IVb pilin [Dehalococcoidia bacterium]
MVTELSLRLVVALQALGNAIEAKFQDEEGQTLAEYGLIMAVIAVAVVVAAGVLFRNAIIGAFNSATNCLSTASTSAGC